MSFSLPDPYVNHQAYQRNFDEIRRALASVGKLPTSVATGNGVVWDGSKWVQADLATQAELDAHKSGFSAQRNQGANNTGYQLVQGADITTDGTNVMLISVRPAVPVWWQIGWRTLVDHNSASWMRCDLSAYLDPADALSGRRTFIGGEGQFHHSGAADWGALGGSAMFALNADTTYTCRVRLTWANSISWYYHTSPEHLYIHGHTVPR